MIETSVMKELKYNNRIRIKLIELNNDIRMQHSKSGISYLPL